VSARHALDRLRRTGLYAILDAGLATPDSLLRLGSTLAGAGIHVFQLRVKSFPDAAAYRLALRLRAAIRGRILLINDRCDLAVACRADGVHLGQDDLPPELARRVLGRQAIVGLSAGSCGEMVRALRARPDYVSIGPAYRTSTKADAGRPLGAAGFGRIAACVPARVPVLAVGGVTPDNVGSLIGSGADAVAAASCWSRAPDPGRTARRFLGVVAAAKKAMRVSRRQAS